MRGFASLALAARAGTRSAAPTTTTVGLAHLATRSAVRRFSALRKIGTRGYEHKYHSRCHTTCFMSAANSQRHMCTSQRNKPASDERSGGPERGHSASGKADDGESGSHGAGGDEGSSGRASGDEGKADGDKSFAGRLLANPSFLFGMAILLLVPVAARPGKRKDWKADVKLEVRAERGRLDKQKGKCQAVLWPPETLGNYDWPKIFDQKASFIDCFVEDTVS